MTEQRFVAVETDLEIVKQLLISTARYAESANRGLDELTVKLDRLTESTNRSLDGLTVNVDRLSESTSRGIEELTESETRTQARFDELAEAEAKTQARLDEFIFQAQRLFTQHADRLERLEGQSERLEAIARMLVRNYEAQQSQMQEFKLTTTATLERMDRILDYLLRQSGGSGTVQ